MSQDFTALYRTCAPGRLPWCSASAEPELVRLVVDGVLRAGMRVVDLGCGQGTEAVFLATQGMRVTGVDAQAKAVTMARRLAAFYGVKAAFKKVDAMKLTVRGFDAAVDRGLFHHLANADYEPYAEVVHRVLRPRGVFFLRCFSTRVPGTWGPRRIRAETIPAVFGTRFELLDLALYDSLGSGGPPVKLWRALMRKK